MHRSWSAERQFRFVREMVVVATLADSVSQRCLQSLIGIFSGPVFGSAAGAGQQMSKLQGRALQARRLRLHELAQGVVAPDDYLLSIRRPGGAGSFVLRRS
jgi:hypothetical protein